MLLGGDQANLRRRPWWIVSASMAGLVLAIAIGGFVGLAFNRTVHDTTDGALRYDVALHDAADDLRLAILDVRHTSNATSSFSVPPATGWSNSGTPPWN